jgi:hypothetical protein
VQRQWIPFPQRRATQASGSTGRKLKPRYFLAKQEKYVAAKARAAGLDIRKIEQMTCLQFTADLAGASYPNRDGSSRQQIVRQCRCPEKLVMVHEEGNRHDKHALKLLRKNGDQLGYVPQEWSKIIVEGFKNCGRCNYSVVAVRPKDLGDEGHLLTLELYICGALQSAPREVVESTVRERSGCG